MVNAWVKACERLKPGMNVILQLLCCLWKGKLDLRKCWTFFFLLTASFVWRFSCILSNSPVTGWRFSICFRFIFIQRSNFRVFRPDRTSVSMHSSIETGWVHCRKYAECIQSTKPTGFFSSHFVLRLWQFFIFGFSLPDRSDAISVSAFSTKCRCLSVPCLANALSLKLEMYQSWTKNQKQIILTTCHCVPTELVVHSFLCCSVPLKRVAELMGAAWWFYSFKWVRRFSLRRRRVYLFLEQFLSFRLPFFRHRTTHTSSAHFARNCTYIGIFGILSRCAHITLINKLKCVAWTCASSNTFEKWHSILLCEAFFFLLFLRMFGFGRKSI